MAEACDGWRRQQGRSEPTVPATGSSAGQAQPFWLLAISSTGATVCCSCLRTAQLTSLPASDSTYVIASGNPQHARTAYKSEQIRRGKKFEQPATAILPHIASICQLAFAGLSPTKSKAKGVTAHRQRCSASAVRLGRALLERIRGGAPGRGGPQPRGRTPQRRPAQRAAPGINAVAGAAPARRGRARARRPGRRYRKSAVRRGTAGCAAW